jgi:hypothetical protein
MSGVEFDLRENRTHYWVQWWEPEIERSLGWHADETEPEYGPVHIQIEFADGTVNRERASVIRDEHPYRSFERRLSQIPEQISTLGWENEPGGP